MNFAMMWVAACAPESIDAPSLFVTPAVVGERASDFVLPSHDGGSVQLSDHDGDVIVVDMSGFH